MSLFAIMIEPQSGVVPHKAIEFILGSDDWFRLMNGRLYLVSSENSSGELGRRLQKILPDEDNVLVVPGDGYLWGLLPVEAWQWFKKYKPDLKYGPEYEAHSGTSTD